MLNRSIDFRTAKEIYLNKKESGKIIHSPRKFGIEFEMVPTQTVRSSSPMSTMLHNYTEKIVPLAWGVAKDGSLSDRHLGVEVQTPPIQLGYGEEAVKKFCKDATELGWITDSSCGIHVHIDANDIKDQPIIVRRLFLLYFVIDYILLNMLPVGRRNNTYCSPLDASKASKLIRSNTRFDKGYKIDNIISTKGTKKDFLEMFYKKDYESIPHEIREHYHEARYHGVNFHPLYGNYGTVEIRYLEGTLDSETILNWTAFHQHIVDSARLVREIEAIELFHIKGPRKRLKRLAEIIKLPEYLLQFGLDRINSNKVETK